MDLQEVLAKTIAMIRGSRDYRGYLQRTRALRSRNGHRDKYIQAMNYEYQDQE